MVYARDGELARGSFWFEDDRSFEYEPGLVDDPGRIEATAINADWYEVIHSDEPLDGSISTDRLALVGRPCPSSNAMAMSWLVRSQSAFRPWPRA